MADNVQVNQRTTDGAIFAADEISSVYYPRTKIVVGADGVNDGDVSAANPLPVELGGDLPDTAAGDLAAIVVDLAAIEVLLGTIDTDTGAIATSAASIDGKITACNTGAVVISSGTVGLSGDLPDTAAGDFASMATDLAVIKATLGTIDGNITACNTGAVVISSGTVSISAIVPGTAATNLGKQEDVAHASGDTGVMALAVSAAAATARAGTAGDYQPLCVSSSNGRLFSSATIDAALPAGTNAIGKLAANSGVDIGDVDVTSIAAGTNTIGGVIAQGSTSIAYDGTTACTLKRFHSANPSDGTSLISAVASKKFRILSFAIFSISGTICRFWLEDADGTDVLGNSTGIALEEDSGAAAPGFVLNHNPGGWVETPTANKNLVIKFAAGSGVVVIGTYIEVA